MSDRLRSWLTINAAPLTLLMVWGVCVAFLSVVHPDAPTCLFKRVTGWPCATCGSTRATLRLLHADVGGALRFNPLMTLLLIAFPIIAAGWVIRPGFWRARAGRLADVASHPPRSPTRLVLAGLVLLAMNWVYVVCAERSDDSGGSRHVHADTVSAGVVQAAGGVAE